MLHCQGGEADCLEHSNHFLHGDIGLIREHLEGRGEDFRCLNFFFISKPPVLFSSFPFFPGELSNHFIFFFKVNHAWSASKLLSES